MILPLLYIVTLRKEICVEFPIITGYSEGLLLLLKVLVGRPISQTLSKLTTAVPLSLTIYRQLVDGSSSTLLILSELRTNYSHICIVY
jgi:hypothetical protein